MNTQPKKICFAVGAILLVACTNATAQTGNVPRFETGVHFTGLKLPSPIGEAPAGLGGRFGYNFSNHFGVEAEVNHFPGGRRGGDFGETQALFGLKAGIASEYGGIFAKVRPGFIHFPAEGALRGRGLTQPDNFALDVGFVAERYFANHTYIRLDAGDTIIAYGKNRILNPVVGGGLVSPGTTHNFQFSFGVGIHF